MMRLRRYVAPGAVGSLYNNGNVTFVGGGALNNLVLRFTGINPNNVLTDNNNCGHDFGCLMDECADGVTTGDSYSKPAIVHQPPKYYGGP